MRNKTRLAALLVLSISLFSHAEEAEQAVTDYTHTGKQYPPVIFITNIDDGDFKQKLQSFNAFSRLDEKAIGLPIGVRILKGHRTKQDATTFSSLMLSASTLGLIPVVSNKEFKVHYDIFVQGESIATFKYQIDSTGVDNFWTAANKEWEENPSEALFMQYTLPQFLTELRDSDEVQSVFREYWEYFDEND